MTARVPCPRCNTGGCPRCLGGGWVGLVALVLALTFAPVADARHAVTQVSFERDCPIPAVLACASIDVLDVAECIVESL